MKRREPFEAEFSEYFASRAPALRRTAYLIVGNWQDAEDVVQTAFVKIYTSWPRIRKQSIDAYARRAVVNTAISHRRKRRRETVVRSVPEPVAPGRGKGQGEERVDNRQDLREALGQLPRSQRAIIALRYLDDLSVAEVARVMDCAEGTVKSQSARALQTLRRHLSDPSLSEE